MSVRIGKRDKSGIEIAVGDTLLGSNGWRVRINSVSAYEVLSIGERTSGFNKQPGELDALLTHLFFTVE